MTEICTFYTRHLFCGVFTEQRPGGPDTPPNKVLWGIRPRKTKFCGVWNPRDYFWIQIFQRIQNRIKKYLRLRTDYKGLLVEKTRGKKYHATIPLSNRGNSKVAHDWQGIMLHSWCSRNESSNKEKCCTNMRNTYINRYCMIFMKDIE